jgi:hypothetical protein
MVSLAQYCKASLLNGRKNLFSPALKQRFILTLHAEKTALDLLYGSATRTA